jgi:hypothetical protein
MSTPGVGLHAHRFAGLATVDVVGTVVAAGIGAWLTGYAWPGSPLGARFIVVLATLFVLGIAVHAAMGIPTAFNVFIGLAPPAV